MSARTPTAFSKMETRKKKEKREPEIEEIEKKGKRGKKVAKLPKKQATPAKKPATSPRGKNSVRAEPIQLEGPAFHGPQERDTTQESAGSLENAHFESINQLALANMSQMTRDGDQNNQLAAEDLMDQVNAANAQFVIPDSALKSSWVAEPDEEDRQRRERTFSHDRSVLQTMTADRGRAGAIAITAEQALEADQRENPERQSVTLAEEFAARSGEYELRNRMIEEFLEAKRVTKAPRKKAAKSGRAAAKRAAALAAAQLAAEEAATTEQETLEYAATATARANEQGELDSVDFRTPQHTRGPSPDGSEMPSISEEHDSEESQEDFSGGDGYVYQRENTSRHGHRERDEYFSEANNIMDEEPSIFQTATQTNARNFFKGAHELTFPSRAPGARWLEETTANALVQGQVIPKLCFDQTSRNSWDTLLDKPLGYYVVGGTNAGNGTTMLRLAHEYGGTAWLPQIIFIEHRAEDHRILVLSDAALAGEIVGKVVLKALTKNGKVTLTSPSNPRGNHEAGASMAGNS